MKALTHTDYQFPDQVSVYHGKVRDVYDIAGRTLVMVATDRISAFDVILPEGIPYKGQVLNQIAAKFLDATTDICPNWKQAAPDPMVTIEHPIVTPTTKAEIGTHDEDISKAEIIARGLMSPEDYEVVERYALALFERGTRIAAERGLILVDTKYEFGSHDGTIYLIDEIHTPDSSRYFYAEGYEERYAKGEPQRQLSKEFVREWLMEHGFQGKPGQRVPEMTPAIVSGISDRYIELYEHITGEPFVRHEGGDLIARIERNVKDYLQQKA